MLPPLETFFFRFQTDNDCLEFLWRSRCSIDSNTAICLECGEIREFRTFLGRDECRLWQCAWCGCFRSPLAGTLFQKSRIPLHIYFDAIGVLADPGRPMRAGSLAYELGVSFTTAEQLLRDLDGRLDAREASAPRFFLDLFEADELVDSISD